MRKISDLKELEDRIEQLESMREVQKEELRNSFRNVAHELSPATMLRKGLKEVINTPGLKATAMDTAVGSGLGFLGKKLITFRSRNVFRKLAGTAVQFIITNIVRNKMPGMRRKEETPPAENPR